MSEGIGGVVQRIVLPALAAAAALLAAGCSAGSASAAHSRPAVQGPRPAGLVVAESVGPVPLAAPCAKAGQARHQVMSVLSDVNERGTVHEAGPRVRGFLQQRGWAFSPWAKSRISPGTETTTGHRAGYTVTLLYKSVHGDVALMAAPPWLTGTPVSQLSVGSEKTLPKG
ncbi:hypothetical protein [Phaeacidiphilus oryzae]|uniref:hypothetical protein n=1 Tax=Phaeacidiphilus oryzae TaxID=348818 RepID=UPI001269AB7C|nr:hypothetical protein [Phaeacidiphilus oryzae]